MTDNNNKEEHMVVTVDKQSILRAMIDVYAEFQDIHEVADLSKQDIIDFIKENNYPGKWDDSIDEICRMFKIVK